MLEDKVKLFSENLARVVDRRKFIKGTGTTVFATIAAAAAGHMSLARAAASGDTAKRQKGTSPPPWPPQCAPPGPYCNVTGTSDGSGCNSSRPYEPSGSCFRHLHNGQMLMCSIMYGWYQAGCWTTAVSGGRWTCCDCGCSTTGQPPFARLCGCAQFSTSPPPRPDSPIVTSSDS